MATGTPDIDPAAPPSGPGCQECLASTDSWWVHLRRCAACGHIGCCDSSPHQHARRHHEATRHPIVRSYEPGESWFWDFARGEFTRGPDLAPPISRPVDQPVPAPADRVPPDWRDLIHR